MSIFFNGTKNQHYISQAEQRKNACNKNAAHRNQEIIKYTKNEKGQFDRGVKVKIITNQSDYDLYTLIKQDNNRKSLENLMNDFESNYMKSACKIEKFCENHTSSHCDFLINLNDIKNILLLKILTRFRNPYFIKETLISSFFNKHVLLDDVRHLEAIIALYKQQNNISFLSKKYKVTENEFENWLSILVSLLLPINGISLLTSVIDSHLNAPEFGKYISIYYYDTGNVLLPDCGMMEDIQSDRISYGFNVTSKIFIILSMPVNENIGVFKIKQRTETEMNQLIYDLKRKKVTITDEEIKKILKDEKLMKKECIFRLKKNDTNMLIGFNNKVRNYSKQHYFSSSRI